MGVWDDGVDVCHDQPFKALHDYRCECYRTVVIVGVLRVLWNRNDGGHLKTCGDYRLVKREVENYC